MCGQRQGGAEGAEQRDGTDERTPPLGAQTSKTGQSFVENRLSREATRNLSEGDFFATIRRSRPLVLTVGACAR